MSQTTIHAIYILVGVVTAIVLFGAATSFLETLVGPWRKLAQRFPAQPVRTDQSPHEGEAFLAFTKKPYSLADDARGMRFLSGAGCLYTLIAALGTAAAIYAIVMLATGRAAPVSVWGLVWASMIAGWTVLVVHMGIRFFRLKAFHRPVTYAADDEHLHLTREGSGGVGNTKVSIPWTEIDPIEVDPVGTRDRAWARFQIAGEHWAHGWRDLVEREMIVRDIPPDPAPPEPSSSQPNAPAPPAPLPASPSGDAWSTERPGDNWGDVNARDDR